MPKRSTGHAPLIEAYGYLPKNVMDISSEPSLNKNVEQIIENSRAIYKQVEEVIIMPNELKKERADKSRRLHTFQ